MTKQIEKGGKTPTSKPVLPTGPPPVPPGGGEYSLEANGLMPLAELNQWLQDMEGGYGRPGSLAWLVDSYRYLKTR